MTSLVEQLTEASKDLLYMSESDYPLEPFIWKREEKSNKEATKDNKPEDDSLSEETKANEVIENADEEISNEKVKEDDEVISDKDANSVTAPSLSTSVIPTADDVLKNTSYEAGIKIEETTLEKFFYRATKIEDWFGDEETKTAQQFSDLQKLLESNLQNIKVFRVGEIQIDVYIVGIDADGNFAGLKTTVIET